MGMTEILISGLLIIIGAVLTLAINGINRQIDTLKELFKTQFDNTRELMEARLKPIDDKLNNHITDTDKKIDELNKKVDLILEKLSNR